jgi:hypothetical protein
MEHRSHIVPQVCFTSQSRKKTAMQGGASSSTIARRRFFVELRILMRSPLLGVRVLQKILLKIVYSGSKPCVVPKLCSFPGK